MTTVAQLPMATSVGPADLLPLSQAGLLYSVSVAELNAGLQPALSVPTATLLGRQSTGTGAPEPIAIGLGLALGGATLAATGADHAGFPVQAAMSLSDELIVNADDAPARLPVTALRGLFSAGDGIAIDTEGVIAVTVSAVAGPAGPAGPSGATGPAGPTGPQGPAGAGLDGPGAGNSASAVGASDYVALWQNGALAWMPYGEFLGGQTIDQLPGAAPAQDSDQLLVAQGGNTLGAQNFGAIWTYVQAKLPTVREPVVELTSDTVLDATAHNQRILVASAALTLSANFANTGAGFSCTLINLAPGSVTMGTGISSGSGSSVLPPGTSTMLTGLSYSGGSTVWWSGVVPNAPTITVGSIAAPAVDSAFIVSGGLFNDAPTALDYSTDGGATWLAAPSPILSANAYSFTAPGLAAGTYTVRVRDHANTAILGVSNSFTITPPTVTLATVPGTVAVGEAMALAGTVSPANAPVQVGLSSSATVAPNAWVGAVVSGGGWTASLTPSAAGTAYVWAEQQDQTSVQTVSGAVTVVTAALSVSAPASGIAASALTVSGTVSPAADTVNVQLATQNTTAPTSGWSDATNSAGSFSAALTPAAAGTYYAWAQDAATGLTAVSSAITVAAAPSLAYGFNDPGGSYVHGVSTIPLNGSVSPPQDIATQVALSTSNTTLPGSGWQAASIVYSNSLWAIYYPTPATAGSYYVWVETSTGGSPAVSSFTVTVT